MNVKESCIKIKSSYFPYLKYLPFFAHDEEEQKRKQQNNNEYLI